MVNAKDFLGRNINIGDQIVYPGRYGSSMWMRFGTVVDIVNTIDWRGNEHPKLKVEIVLSNWNGSNKRKKIVTLECINRVTVLKELAS